jgi:aryl-alcohol dehydrogenase-like predicted oxidoreductase
MNHTFLAHTGVKVSPLCYGTMSFGADADEPASADLYARCRDAGVNFFDTANVYSKGRSEEILGRLAEGHRDEVVIATKAYFPMSDDPNARGASRRHLMLSVRDSLRRLRTDYVDLLYIHRFDDRTDLDQTLSALDDLVRSGQVVYTGASNFAAWQVAKALGRSALHHWAAFTALQPMYNLLKRQAEVEILPMAQSEHMAVFPYSPLAGGILTGKYLSGDAAESSRLNTNKMYQTRYSDESIAEIARAFVALAKEHAVKPATLAVAWVAAHPGVTAPIIGARNVAQLEDSLAAARFEMTPSLYEKISALSPTPPPATDRSEETSAHSINNR